MRYYTEVGRQLNNFILDKNAKHLSCGKEAISDLISKLSLKKENEVFINTTFGTKYVSSCVTSTIFNYCKPSKVLSDSTKLIFIIHEFGFPNENIFELKKLATEKNIPIVEDCAQSGYSFFKNGSRIGTIGDYSIYSLKKILPYNNAGFLLNSNEPFPYIDELKKSYELRFENYIKLRDIFMKAGIQPFINDIEGISPYVFPFKLEQQDISTWTKKLERFDLIYWVNLDLFSLPVHQLLDNAFFDEIEGVINS